MLRLRRINGKVEPLPKESFVELVDEEGNVALLVYQDNTGVCHVVRPGDPEAKRYSGFYKVPFCTRFIDLDRRPKIR